jgi:DNA-binding NtrC family response regulator
VQSEDREPVNDRIIAQRIQFEGRQRRLAMKTVLIVDAEYSAQHTMTLLTRQGFHAVMVRSGRDALGRLEKGERFDLMISEAHLPDMSGVEFLTAVKRRRTGMPVIVVTNRFSIDSYLRAVSLGVIEYLNKPVVTGEFSRIVRLALAYPDAVVSAPRASA